MPLGAFDERQPARPRAAIRGPAAAVSAMASRAQDPDLGVRVAEGLQRRLGPFSSPSTRLSHRRRAPGFEGVLLQTGAPAAPPRRRQGQAAPAVERSGPPARSPTAHSAPRRHPHQHRQRGSAQVERPRPHAPSARPREPRDAENLRPGAASIVFSASARARPRRRGACVGEVQKAGGLGAPGRLGVRQVRRGHSRRPGDTAPSAWSARLRPPASSKPSTVAA